MEDAAAGRKVPARLVFNRWVDPRDVADHLLQHARWSATRSSGPGGQRRDKVETRAELTLDLETLETLETLEGLEPGLAARLAERLGLHERPLRITSQEERSLVRNQERAAERLTALVAEALAPPPPPRRPTRPSRGQREARLSEKNARGAVKRLRQRPGDQE